MGVLLVLFCLNRLRVFAEESWPRGFEMNVGRGFVVSFNFSYFLGSAVRGMRVFFRTGVRLRHIARQQLPLAYS
jgi:hypothetical protein